MSPARMAAVGLALLALGCAATQEPSVLALDRMARSSTAATPVPEGPPRRSGGGTADGELPPGTTVRDDLPGITRLDARLREQLRAATDDAAAQGIGIVVNSGWRSRAYQTRLFDEAVTEHGSETAAAAWVARPGTSVHEAGLAVDVGPQDATAWLAEHGADHGLCPVYANEPWHFELVPTAVEDGCPPPYDDPADDPRLQG